MSQWNYFVTAQKPTAITHAIGPLCFTSREPADLVISRVGGLEIYQLRSRGESASKLESVLEVPLHARIAALESFRLVGEKKDLLLVLSEKRQVVVFRYCADTRKVVSVAAANLQDCTGRPVDHAPLCACDPFGRVVSFYLYEGLLKLVPLARAVSDPAKQAQPEMLDRCGMVHSTRVAEPRVLDIAFLYPSRDQDFASTEWCGAGPIAKKARGEKPALAVLYADGQGSFLATWLIDLQAYNMDGDRFDICDLTPGPTDRDGTLALKPGSTKLAPVPLPSGGTLVLGGSSVTYHDNAGRRVAGVCGGPKDVAAVAMMEDDGSRWLLGDIDGSIWLLHLHATMGCSTSEVSTGAVYSLVAEHLGIATLPRALVHLSEGHVFVASSHGDSQLIQLVPAVHTGCQFVVRESWTNLGPILDFCVADIDDQGRNQIVTCSGVGRTGSLRFVRIGVGVNEVGSLSNFDSVLGMWTLGGIRSGLNDSIALVLSFVGSTRVLTLTGNGGDESVLAEKPAPGFVSDEQTILCCEAAGIALQVTCGGVRAASLEALAPLAWWAPPAGTQALVAVGARNGLIVSLSSMELVLLHVQQEGPPGNAFGIHAVASLRISSEVACLDFRETLCAVGMWSRQLQIQSLRADNFSRMHCETLPIETIPRSCVFARIRRVLYLLVGLGDGRLLDFHVNESTGALSQRRAVCLGSHPIRLLSFRSQTSCAQSESDEHIFATGDRPTIVHGHTPASEQLAYSAVNLRHVSHIATFSTVAFSGCLAFLTEGRLMIGSFDDIQRVHVRTVPLGKSPHRIAYQKQWNVFAVACHAEDMHDSPPSCSSIQPAHGASSSSSCMAPPPPDVQMDGAAILFIHASTLEVVQAIRFDVQEPVSSMTSVTFESDPCEYLAVGTAVVAPEEPEPVHGRIIVYANRLAFAASGKSFTPVCEIDVPGAVYALVPFKGALLGAVNNRVNLWRWVDNKLQCVCHYIHYIISLYLQTLGDFILVGDLMRSASLLTYNSEEQTLVEVARDSSSAWLTSIGMLSESVFLCTDDGHNIFTLQRGSNPAPSTAPAGPAVSSSSTATTPGGGADNTMRLGKVGQMHMGEFVNRMHRATLIQPPPSDTSGDVDRNGDADKCLRYTPLEQVVWASVDGAIGIIASLRSGQDFARLSLIQDVLAREKWATSSLDGLAHGEWRDFWVESQGIEPHKGFIDGNLLESLLELPRSSLQKLVDSLRAQNVLVDGVPELLREVEELARLH